MVPPDQPRRKRTKSETLRLATLEEYVHAHAKPNGHGWKGFFKSNLFASLVVFLLTQTVFITGVIISFYYRTAALSEWRAQIDLTLKRMDDWGTTHGHFSDERQDNVLTVIEPRLKRVEEDTKHIEVLESEHRRLTKDVEELRNGKK